MFNKNTFIAEFNFRHGTRYSTSTERIQKMLDKIPNDVTDREMLAYSMHCAEKEEHDLYKALQPQNVSQFIYEYRGDKQEEQNSFEHTYGLLEKALADVIFEKYSDTLAKDVYEKVDEYVQNTYGNVTRTITYEVPECHSTLEDSVTHERFETVLKWVLANEPVMLVGPAGTGKNVICKQVSEAMGLDFYFSGAVTQEHKFTGFIDANGVYHETQFYKAFKNGGLFFLDEIDGSIPEVLILLNGAIANGYFDFPTGKVYAHEDFRVIAAGNTYGTGASYEYSGRLQLDGASLDRFTTVYVGYSQNIENALTHDIELLAFIRAFRHACTTNGINHIVSYRSITRLSKMSETIGLRELIQSGLTKNLEIDDLNIIKKALELRGDMTDNKWYLALQKI